jgi:hypothetical protein
MLGVVAGTSNLLVPLALDDEGLSAGAIGLAFGVASGVWIGSAALVGRLGSAGVDLRGVGLVVAVLAVAWLLLALRLSTLALLAFLVVSHACRSTASAINFGVGVRASAGNTAPVVSGVMNLVGRGK